MTSSWSLFTQLRNLFLTFHTVIFGVSNPLLLALATDLWGLHRNTSRTLSMLSSGTEVRPALLPLYKHPFSTNCRYHLVMLFLHGASFLNRARNSRCTAITDLGTSKRSTQKAFSCCDTILKTGPAVPQPRSKHEKRTAGSAWETWTVAAADGVRFARVRWEINFFLTFQTAQFFYVYPVYCTFWTLMKFINEISPSVSWRADRVSRASLWKPRL